MVSSRQWARDFSVKPEDVDYLLNVLLEKETPLSSRELAALLVERKLAMEAQAFHQQYADAVVYDPSQRYEVGQRIIFPSHGHAVATVSAVRAGDNPEYGDFSVISVKFPDTPTLREFAAELRYPHVLTANNAHAPVTLPGSYSFTAADVMAENGDALEFQVELALEQTDGLVMLARQWFPRDLMIEVDLGALNLAEAALEMNNGGPLHTTEILEVIGPIANAPQALQEFSLNYALNQDSRFDEVGPAGEVLWYLTSHEPQGVREKPPMLHYEPIEYQRSALTPSMVALEREIDDELSRLTSNQVAPEGVATLIYPHLRAGTLPLNSTLRDVFPTARRAPRIYVTLVDGQDGEEYVGWVVHEEDYVLGLSAFYEKHQVPVGAIIKARRDGSPGRIVLDLHTYKPHIEYVTVFSLKDNQPTFESLKRPIGMDFDSLMILGVEQTAQIDALAASRGMHSRQLSNLLKMLIAPLGALTPQGAVHLKTLYSAVNVLRRCPPGPIFATLRTNPDFENVGGDYWKLSES